MRRNPTKRIENHRITTGPLASEKSFGANGAFEIPLNGVLLTVIVSNGEDWVQCGLPGQPWEHVSVSLKSRCPTWREMDAIKRIFWSDSATVMQLHVPRDKHINTHENCLHLWKPLGVEIPLPPEHTVG